jgi:hypothetical protein
MVECCINFRLIQHVIMREIGWQGEGSAKLSGVVFLYEWHPSYHHDDRNCDRPHASGNGDDRDAAVMADRHNRARHPFCFFRGAGHHHRSAEADRGRVRQCPLGAGICGFARLAWVRCRRDFDGADRRAYRRALDDHLRRADERGRSRPVERRRTLVTLYWARGADGSARQCRDHDPRSKLCAST